MFNLVNLETHPTKLAGLTVETLPNPQPESKFDLTLYAIDEPTEIRLVGKSYWIRCFICSPGRNSPTAALVRRPPIYSCTSIVLRRPV